jgi:hypothetical protein
MVSQGVSRKVRQNLVPVLVLMAAMLPATLWAGTLKDNFSNGNMNGWDSTGAPNNTWEVKNGELIVTPSGYPVGFSIGETTWKDYTIRVRAKIVKHQSTGSVESATIGARSSSFPMYGYVFGFGSIGNKCIFCFRAEGNIGVFIAVFKPFEWELDKWYDLKLTAEGDQFRFYVNDELVIEYTDTAYPAGKVGIGAAFSTTTAHFDDFSVTGNDIPDTLTSVSPKDKLATVWGKVKGK